LLHKAHQPLRNITPKAKMTTYTFEVKFESLNRLPSVQHVAQLCLYTSTHILGYIDDVVLWDKPQAQQVVKNQRDLIKRYLRLLTYSEPTTGQKIKLHHIFVDKTTRLRRFKKGFDWDTLPNVPPKILLEIFTALIDTSVDNIASRVHQTMSTERLDECIETLALIPDTISKISGIKSDLCPNFTSLILRVEFGDEKDEVDHFTYQRQRWCQPPQHF